jgi:CO/xanthine dehydrogenase Mo-binding subunit
LAATASAAAAPAVGGVLLLLTSFMVTVPAGNDGGPFWWPKLCDALQKKYEGEEVALVGGEDILQAEARAILRGFVSGCQLHDTNLFGGGAD